MYLYLKRCSHRRQAGADKHADILCNYYILYICILCKIVGQLILILFQGCCDTTNRSEEMEKVEKHEIKVIIFIFLSFNTILDNLLNTQMIMARHSTTSFWVAKNNRCGTRVYIGFREYTWYIIEVDIHAIKWNTIYISEVFGLCSEPGIKKQACVMGLYKQQILTYQINVILWHIKYYFVRRGGWCSHIPHPLNQGSWIIYFGANHFQYPMTW